MRTLPGFVAVAFLGIALAGCLQGEPGPAARLLITIDFHEEPLVVHADGRFDDNASLDVIHWDWGDGTSGMGDPGMNHTYLRNGTYNVTASADHPTAGRLTASKEVVIGALESPPDPGDPQDDPDAPPETPSSFIPHVVVGVPDSGFNVYHEVYRRPELTVHPCTYIQDYPCDIPALELTLDAATWDEAFEADQAKWQAIRPGDRYWIPGTNIIGAVCDQPYEGSTVGSTNPTGDVDLCIIDDTNMHGTGTSSSVLSENPDALLVVVEGNAGGVSYLTDGTFPIDIISFSWGAAAPITTGPILAESYAPFFVAASGNEGAFPVVLDSSKAHTSVITVGGADGASQTEPGHSGWKTMEYVSEYCRPTAQTRSLDETRERFCGTSFAAPTLAGALSRVVYELRVQSGYTGSIQDDVVDPILDVDKWDVRRALNHTATYTPDSPFGNDPELVPLVAPEYQWGWGYIARNEVPAILACILEDDCASRPMATVTYMEALWDVRRANSGEAVGF